MDNKEIDEILKEKLKNGLKPSPELELKVIRRVEQEKQKILEGKENFQKTSENKNNISNKKTLKEINHKGRKLANLGKFLSMAAVIVIVFTIGMKFQTPTDNENTNLISIRAIKPTNLESGIITNDSEFIIEVEGENISAETVKKSVYIEPALDYTIERTSNKNEYKLKFKQNIPDNTIVKLQYIKNQITENSWAYQTSNKLSVTRTYPDNERDVVSKNTVIDVEFSYANVENFKQNVKITPEVKGKWKHLGNIWRFTPSSSLKENQKYVITINKNVQSGKQTLDEDYIFSFIVSEDGTDVYYTSASMDRIITARTDEQIRIPYADYKEEKTKINNKVEISKFANIDDFINYLEVGEIKNLTKQGDYEVTSKEQENSEFRNDRKYLEFKKTLPKGYYLATVKTEKGKELFICPIQISEMSAYAIETERDVLVWVAKGNKLAQNINVEYQGKNVKTDAEGIAKFEGIADNSEKVKYLKIDNELIIGVYNYNLENYPNAYIYTDRPLYKNTDTINIWGFIPKSLFYDKIEDEFYVELNSEGKKKIEVGKEGSFQTKINLKNHADSEYACVALYYKNTMISNRYINIKNYELQNYTYEVICDKNYGYDGDKIKIDVQVNHITGLTVPNKNVVLTYGDRTLKEKTGEDGIAHFTVKLSSSEAGNTTNIDFQGVSIFNGDAEEYTEAETDYSVYVLNRNTYTDRIYDSENRYKVVLYKLADDKNVNIDYEVKKLYDGTYETKVDVNLIEEISKRVITGYEYNEYTKENEPQYEIERDENKTKIKTVTSKNGVVEINKDEIKQKQSTDDISYSYTIEIAYKDLKGREVEDSIYIYNEYNERNYLGYRYENYNTDVYQVSSKLNTDMYYTYRYLLKTETEKFKIGDAVNFNLAESTYSGIKDVQNEGEILTVVFKEEILKVNQTSNKNGTIKYTFTKRDFPGCNITGAFFKDGKFYRLPIQYFDFDEQTNKVDVEIKADKEVYKPGDEVKLTLKTTKNGKGVKSIVNVSVVNEAVFAIEDDIVDLMDKIYENKSYPAYTFSSYTDIINSSDGGAGGGDGTPRANFADTAHFETINTNGSGVAEVKFKLPENVTTYRVTAQSVNEDLEIGTNTKKITSKLDFFVQSVAPRGIKTSDDVVLNATAVADTKYKVDYEFTIKEINKTMTSSGNTNVISTVNFGSLPFGTYHAVIKGKYGNYEDAIEYEFKVIESNQEVYNRTTMNVTENTTIKPSKNPIVLEIYNKNMSEYVEYIDFIENTVTQRLDTQIAYNKVQELKDKYYGTDLAKNSYVPVDYYSDGSYLSNYLSNLENSKNDLVLTALVRYYAGDYGKSLGYLELTDKDNIFEYYLILAANNEPVLADLIYLKEEDDISNYSKLLVTLGLEFVGDYTDAKELYNKIDFSNEEKTKYQSLIAIVETFINKKEVKSKIDTIIKNSPADEYVRFAILSYFQNNSADIEKEETVNIISKNLNKTIALNGMKIETYTIYDEDLTEIKFETDSEDIMVSYYYQTLLDNVEDSNIKKDIKLSGKGEIRKGNTVEIIIEFTGNYEGNVRIALPNSLRLAQSTSRRFDEESKFYIESNNIDYITIYKTKKCKKITLPLLVTSEGKYKFENVVCTVDGVYHISNAINLNIK